jgi:hypothetical protein
MGFVTNIILTCPKCSKIIEAVVALLHTEINNLEKSSDIYEIHRMHFLCNHCEHLFNGFITISNKYECEAFLDGYNDVVINCGNVEFPEEVTDDYLFGFEDGLYVADPYCSFAREFLSLEELLDSLYQSSSRTNSIQRRMILSYCVTILETYLSDTIKSIISYKEDKCIKLIMSGFIDNGNKLQILEYLLNKGHNSKKESYSEYIQKQALTIINNTSLQGIQNIENVYKIVTDIPKIITKTGYKNEYKDLLEKRHHCIHRNGKDKDGEPIALGIEYLSTSIKLIKNIGDHIENQLRPPRKSLFD